jgi:hypothetical protein
MYLKVSLLHGQGFRLGLLVIPSPFQASHVPLLLRRPLARARHEASLARHPAPCFPAQGEGQLRGSSSTVVLRVGVAEAQGCPRVARRRVATPHQTHPLRYVSEPGSQRDKGDECHVPPGTPPPMTPAIATLASSRLVCCSGSISTPESLPISRILPRICYMRTRDRVNISRRGST